MILRDVTDRKLAEERFSTLIEYSSDVITVMDDEEVIQYASPSVERVLGYAPEELIGESAADYIHRDDRSIVLTGVTDAVEDEEVIVDRAEYRFRHADGSWVWLESVGSNRTQSPAVEGFVINSRDVTERKRYERRLQVLNRVLRHDLRNDINMVLAHADDLVDGHRGPDDIEAKARAIREKGLDIADLSEKARQLEQTLTLDGDDLEPIDIVEVVERQIRAVERDYPDVAVERDLSDRACVSASGLIDSAIDNLLENAIEHNDADEPEIRIEISDGPDGLVSVSIADNGPGIPVVERAVLQRGEENQLDI